MIRIVLPAHLKTLAKVDGEVTLDLPAPPTHGAVLDALEATYPMLRGTIRDQKTKERRAFIRFFACGGDFSDVPADDPLPDDVVKGVQVYRIVGAIAGG